VCCASRNEVRFSQDRPHPTPLPNSNRATTPRTSHALARTLPDRPRRTATRVEEALDDLGALSITLQDADAETPDEQAIFEPGVASCRCGRRSRSTPCSMPAPIVAASPRRWANCCRGWSPINSLSRRRRRGLGTRAWMDQFKPMPFGRGCGSIRGTSSRRKTMSIVVRLDPGLAFGSGTHPTTALCLEWLDGLELAGKTVIDYGCGSGILAIAALKLGAPAPSASTTIRRRSPPRPTMPSATASPIVSPCFAGRFRRRTRRCLHRQYSRRSAGRTRADVRRPQNPARRSRSPASCKASRTNCCALCRMVR
jgi:hypothetical protein